MKISDWIFIVFGGMAGGGGGVILVSKFLIILCLTTRIHTWGHTYIKTSTVQDQNGQESKPQLLSYYQLNGFNGLFLLQSCSNNVRPAAATGASQCVIKNSEKCFQNKSKIYNLTQIFIVALAQCGDIQTNPGPSNIHRKRINKISFPCSSCQRGIRRRPVICYVCKNLTHSKCIKGLTNDLYDKLYNDNEVIVYELPTLPASSINAHTQVEGHIICKCGQKVIKKNNKKTFVQQL